MAETRTINLEIQDNVKSLKTQYKEAVQEVQRLAQAYGETSQEAAEAARRAAQLKDQIEDTNDAIASFKGEGVFTATGKALGAVASGFSAVEGAVALTGVESEKLQETMVRLQAAMALSQGLEGLEDAGRAFNTLNTRVLGLGKTAVTAFQGMTAAGKAFALTGIGLVITGIALAVANWDKLTGKTNANTEAQKKNMEAAKAREDAVLQAQKSAVDGAAKEGVEFFKLANALKETNAGSKDREKLVNQMNAQYGTTLKNLKNEAAFQDQINKSVQDFVKYQNIKIQSQVIEQQLFNIQQQRFELETKLKELNVGNAVIFQNVGKEQKKTNSIIDQSLGAINNQTDALAGLNYQTKSITENQNTAYNKQGSQTIAQAGKITDQIGKLDSQFASLAATLLELQGKMGNFNKKTGTSTKLIADYTNQVEKEKINAMEDGMDKRIKLLELERDNEIFQIDKKGKKAGELKTAIEAKYSKEIEDVKKEFRDRSDRDDQIHLEKLPIKRLETGKQEIDAEKYVQGELARLRQEQKQRDLEDLEGKAEIILKYAKTFVDVYSSLNGLLNASDDERLKKVEKGSAEEKKIRKRMFERDKALRISQVVVDTASNIITSVKNGGGVPFGIPFGIAAGTMGALQIAAIAKTKFDGGEQSTNQNSPDATAGTNVSAPQFNTIGSSGVNQLAQLQNVPVQAYVVSGEVTSAQALDRNRVQNATL